MLTYNSILNSLSNMSYYSSLKLAEELRLTTIAKWLKNKFNDKRSTEELVFLIKQEYNLLG